MVPIDLEEAAELRAVIAAAETVSAEHGVAARNEWPDLVGERAHVVGGGDERALAFFQARVDVRRALRLGRVQPVPAFCLEPFAPELGEARHAPDVRDDTEVRMQQVGGGNHLAENGAGAEQLHPRCSGLGALMEQVDAAQDPFLGALG